MESMNFKADGLTHNYFLQIESLNRDCLSSP